MSSHHDSSAGKTLALLNAFTGARSVLGISELSIIVDLPKSTVHRLVGILISSGYVTRVGDRYTLSGRVFELGNQVKICRPNGLRDRGTPYMTELFNITGHTVHLGIMSGTDIVYLEKIYGHNSAKVRTSVGSRRPAYSTALGKAILAHTHPDEVGSSLPAKLSRITPYTISSEGMIFKAFTRIREEGTATDYEESFHGLSCLAAPIFHTESCAPVAALSLSVPANGRSVLRHRNALLDAARHLSKELGYMPMVSL